MSAAADPIRQAEEALAQVRNAIVWADISPRAGYDCILALRALLDAAREMEKLFVVLSPGGHPIEYGAWVSAMDQIEANRISAEKAEAALAEAKARIRDLERHRTSLDCRYVGEWAEIDGSHCPSGDPCERCEMTREVAAAEARCAELRGAMEADDHRPREAAIRVWGEHIRGCDTPDEMAELILSLRARCAELERERDKALAERDSYRFTADRRWAMRDELERLLGVGDTYGEEQFERGVARLRGLIAAESRADRYETALREIAAKAECTCSEDWRGKKTEPCAGAVARAALARLVEVGQ